MTTSGSHTLTFSRLRANFTVDKELIGKQDPYIIFQSGQAKVQTKAIKGVGTGTAEWKESYSLEKFSPSHSSIIEVTVYNHNTLLPDSVIGHGTVDLSHQSGDSLSGSGGPLTVNLTDKKGQEVGSLSFVTNGGGYTGRGGSGMSAGGIGGATGGNVVARGAGTDQRTAQKASDTAAAQGRDVTLEGRNAVGVGHPVGSGSHTTGSGYGSTTGTGVTSGTHGTGVTSGTHGSGTTGQRSTMGEKAAGFIPGTEENKDKKAGYAPGQGPHDHTHGNVTAGEKAASFIPGTQENRDKKAGVGGTTGVGHTSGHTTGVTGTGVSATSGAAFGTKEGEVIDKKYYVGHEQRAQDQALIEQYREHNPYAKDYETTVQHTGRERLVGSQIEALGTRERVIGQDHKVQAHPQQEIARNLPASGAVVPGVGENTGALDTRPGGEGWVQTKPGPVCDTNTFSITGDRIVDKERVTDLREHRDFEKEFEVKTRLVGERALERGAEAEILNRERVLVDEKNKVACEGHPTTGNVSGPTLASQGGVGTGTTAGMGHTGMGHTGAGHTGVGHTGTGHTGQRSTMGEKAAGFIPGTEENRDKKQGYAPGQGPSDHTHGNVTAGEKAASFIPGTQENRDKKTQTSQYS